MKSLLPNNKSKIHLFFLIILSLNYLIPLLTIGNLTLFYNDNLDSFVVYNKIIGKFYNGEKEAFDIFLAGNIEFYYSRFIFKPFIFIYKIFDTELAYWTTDITVRLVAYISTYLLAKKINNNFFVASLVACIYASMLYYTTFGFGAAIAPYLYYLASTKSRLSLKHYFVLIFFGLNSDLVADLFLGPILVLILAIVDFNSFKKNIFTIFKIFSIFTFFAFLTSSNLIYLSMFGEEMHRIEFANSSVSILESVKFFFSSLFHLNFSKTWSFFRDLPLAILSFGIVFSAFSSKNKKVKKLLVILLSVYFLWSLENLELFINLKNNSFSLIKMYNFGWIAFHAKIILVLLLLYLLKKKEWFTKYLILFSFTSLLILQVDTTIVPLIKKNYLYENNQNNFTFDGYYNVKNYKEFSKIIENKRTISIGVDPMVAVYNNIKVLDGYHTFYPLEYKNKFRQIISRELENNNFLKNYYDNWGSRVYSFINNPNDILINFDKAKIVGAEYVISKYEILTPKLKRECLKCVSNLYLYKIN